MDTHSAAEQALPRRPIQPKELLRVVLSGTAFFLILCSYYILRPVRDDMTVRYGADKLHWLFTGTLLLTLIAVPVFGWVVRHLPRPAILPAVYGFFIVNLLAFYLAFSADAFSLATAGTFFVWLSVFNLFAISLFWSVVSDSFTKAESHRLYAYIAAGGTAGALAGPAITALLAKGMTTAALIALSALLLAIAAVCMVILRRNRHNSGKSQGQTIGGSLFAGVPLTLKLPMLRGVALLIVCYTAVSTVLYIHLVDLVGESFPDSGARKAFFAKIDLTVNCLALATQLLGTRTLVERFGLRLALSAVPVLLFASLLGLSLWATAVSFAAVQVLHRVAEYAISRPGREMVYTTVDAESRYKAKSFIDTAVYRANDAATAWLIAAVRGLGLNAVLVVGIPAAIAWFFTAYQLGERHDRIDDKSHAHDTA